nr:efflux RND transporter periplasmic adaptor subunit [Aquicoccus sp. G2-2]MEA1113982.1 efflux RND transporter periplasmic adaptor subunit [Aquicoccus sp. G2-2]
MSKREADRARRAAEGAPRKRRRWLWGVVVLLIIAGGGYGYYALQKAAVSQADAPASGDAVPVMQVSTLEMQALKPQTLQRAVKVIGTLDPLRQAQLSAQVNGRVEAVLVQPGDPVSAGDVLVQIDIETLTLELDQMKSNKAATQAQLELAEAKLKRAAALIDRGVTTASNLDEAESSVRGLRASVSALTDQVSGARLRLRNATVRAPFDGVISARAVEPGQYVSTGAPLVTVVDLSSVEMQANAPVGAGSLLARGQSVNVRVDGIPNRVFEGKVTRINPVADEGTRTIPVYVLIDNADRVLLGGMFATGQVIVTEVKDALAIPAVALREDAHGHHVLVIKDGHLHARPVETGGEWAGGLTRITKGLAPGDMVVTAPLPQLNDGDAVEIVEG